MKLTQSTKLYTLPVKNTVDRQVFKEKTYFLLQNNFSLFVTLMGL
jgi:hypothetical protein